MKEIRRIDYEIDTRKYLSKLFSGLYSGKELTKAVNESNPVHMIYSQIGYDEEQNERTYHICDRYEMYDLDKKEKFWCNDKRATNNTIKELMWLCQEHFTSWNNVKLNAQLKEKGITWKEVTA